MANPFQGDDVDPFSGARDEEGEIEREKPKKSFGQAFAEARRAGDKTFMFNGKKYTTELKGEKKDKPAKKEEAKAEPAKAEPAKDEPRRKTPREKFKGLMGVLGNVKTYKSGGSVSKRADGCATKGKTRGRMV